MENIDKKSDLIFISAIGGIGMSAIANALLFMGYKVTGSDKVLNSITNDLQKRYKIKIYSDQIEENVRGASIVIRSSAIRNDNPEIIGANKLNIPVIHRSDALAFLFQNKDGVSISGTHGKTTTTGITASAIKGCKKSYASIINGGIMNNWKNNAVIDKGNIFIAEADESDGTFIKYSSKYRILINIDEDHMDFYKTYDNLLLYFKKYILETPKDGYSIICIDCPNVEKIYDSIENKDRIITYGKDLKADYNIKNIRETKRGMWFDVKTPSRVIKEIFCPVYGEHNAINCIPSVILYDLIKMPIKFLKIGLRKFKGIERRFNILGKYKNSLVIDDYSHHPREMEKTLNVAKKLANYQNGKLIVIYEQHRYTRLKDLYEEFSQSFNDEVVDLLLLMDIYSVRETENFGFSQETFFENIRKYRRSKSIMIKQNDEIKNVIDDNISRGDVILFMGAGGSVSLIADSLIKS